MTPFLHDQHFSAASSFQIGVLHGIKRYAGPRFGLIATMIDKAAT
jgi:hypothetical protein